MNKKELYGLPLNQLIEEYPFMEDYLANHQLVERVQGRENFTELLERISQEEQEEWAIDVASLAESFYDYYLMMQSFLGLNEEQVVRTITLLAGQDKNGHPEHFKELTIEQGQVVAIVGPTGSGKSRLLADIEWTADADTPTRRRLLINGQAADKKWRLSSSNSLVAQLSQNMNFVMDLTVQEFLELHAESRLINDVASSVTKIMTKANQLAGEPFTLETPITSLSGGQSRALMIADTAILSKSPIVLIDEIENAGIDREQALKVLIGEEKIVLMATHDPILALMADIRVIIAEGGITKVLTTSPAEKQLLTKMKALDFALQRQRQALRRGDRLQSIDFMS